MANQPSLTSTAATIVAPTTMSTAVLPKQKVALPLHVQKLQRALDLDKFIDQVELVFNNSLSLDKSVRDQLDVLKDVPVASKSNSLKVYNFSNVTEERQWIKDLLLSPSEGSESELSETEQLQIMLELQTKRRKKWRKRLKKQSKVSRYKYLSAGLLLPKDPYLEHTRKLDEKKHRKGKGADGALGREEYRQKLWMFIVKKEIPKMAKQFSTSRHNTLMNNKKIALLCQREVKKSAIRSQRASKEVSSVQPRARRLMKEALIYWRKYEKVEREQRKRAEKEALEQRKRDDEMREAKRQQRKLNFLITQTELYAHFIGKKLTGEADRADKILQKLEDTPLQREIRPGVVVNLEAPEDYDSEAAKAQALANVQSAFQKQQTTHNIYHELAKGDKAAATSDRPSLSGENDLQESFDKSFSLATPMLQSDQEVPQPTIFDGQLKVYQLKGMNWLANLYDQGINGILADEMGLGKTVQSVAFMAHLAERQGIWGPFLIVSPASTLHNWQQECTRFVPKFKVLPYWGSPQERKIIRKYWNQKLLYKENAPFHILITSYQLVVQDVKYFQRVKWQYMILDEAQAIKSSNSIRWKVLLSFNCRNRLLLTGTPIQNTMQELWALLHFIMPSMFDSHEEFNEWFSRDIESHAEKKSVMDEHQLSRLHLILKPFMLRRIKKDVEHEMAEKIEVHLSCLLSTRQKKLYQGLRQRISIDDLLQSSLAPTSSKDSATSHLLNLVMQFRKVCNHPDLFERRNVVSPSTLSLPAYTVPRIVYLTPIPPSPHYYRLTKLGMLSVHYIYKSTVPDDTASNGCWAFHRLANWSSQEASCLMLGDLSHRLEILARFMKGIQLLYQQRFWNAQLSHSRYSQTQLLLWPSFKLSYPSRTFGSSVLCDLVFTSHTHCGYSHVTHRVYPLQTPAHTSAELTKISSTVSGEEHENGKVQLPPDVAKPEQLSAVVPSALPLTPTSQFVMWTEMPSFVAACTPKVLASWEPPYCSSRSAEYHRLMWLNNGGPPHLKAILFHGPDLQEREDLARAKDWNSSIQALFQSQRKSDAGLVALSPLNGWSHIQIPDKVSMISDSGKMTVLDKLLVKLKQEQHRVLIYSQMTRMIDLLEEFMGYRRYRYIRLDGSSRISDRRDMVADFQANAEIFVFLLSTRAGGLGINLTAADTVIFYDSDWNPTVDQQAMDRAHRLGQTKQVTVYRLIVKGTIEEKILRRAREKSEIQKMVIAGGDFKPDTLKAKEMVSLLLDDDEMETRFLAKQAEKKAIMEKIEQGKRAKNNKKRLLQNSRVDLEPALKRPKSGGSHDLIISTTPSPMTLNSSRPASVVSSTAETLNGDDSFDIQGSTDGSEVNSEVSGAATGTTPVRKLPKSRREKLSGEAGSGGAAAAATKRTAAPLGGRGKMQKSSKKGGARSAASAGAIAGAKAATNAAYAAYGLPTHHLSLSPAPPGGYSVSAISVPSTTTTGSSTHSSPRVSPVPVAFVATSLVTTPPSNKSTSSKAPSSLTYAKNNL